MTSWRWRRRLVAARAALRDLGGSLWTLAFTFVIYLLIGTLLATVPPFVQSLGFGPVLAGSAISLQYLATFLTRPAAGRHADQVGPKRTVCWGLLTALASSVLVAAAGALRGSPYAALACLGASRLLLGAAESFVGTGTIAWGIGRLGPARMSGTLSVNGLLSYGGLALGAPLGVLLVRGGGMAGLGLAGAALAGLGLVLGLLRAAVPPVPGEPLGFAAVFLRVLPHGMALALAATGFGTVASFVTLYYQARGWAGAEYALAAFGGCFACFRVGLSRAIMLLGGLRVAALALVLEVAALVVLAWAPGPAVAVLCCAALGFGFSPIFPALGVVAVARVPPASRGAAFGTYNLFADVSLAVIGPAAGLIAARAGYGAVFLAAAAMVAAALATVCALMARPDPVRAG